MSCFNSHLLFGSTTRCPCNTKSRQTHNRNITSQLLVLRIHKQAQSSFLWSTSCEFSPSCLGDLDASLAGDLWGEGERDLQGDRDRWGEGERLGEAERERDLLLETERDLDRFDLRGVGDLDCFLSRLLERDLETRLFGDRDLER